MNKKITVNLALAIAIIAMAVTFSVTMTLSIGLFDKTVSSVREKEIMYNNIAEIDKNVRDSYYGTIVDDTLYDTIGAGYMQGIGDSQARYYTAARYTEYLNEQSGKVLGVGIEIAKTIGSSARVIRVYAGSPAEEAGIQRNWYITKVGDNDVRALTTDQVNTLLRGEEGTSITLTCTDMAMAEQPAIELQRQPYDVSSVTYSLAAGRTAGYIQINTFNSKTAGELTAAIAALKEQGTITSLVFDVRNNTGDALTEAIKCIDLLCPAGTIASQQNKDGTLTLLGISDNKSVNLPMVVLVNKNTAFGAELFADSLRQFNGAKIVGDNTAGKGTILCTPQRLSNGAAISYSIGILVPSNGVGYDGVGIAPDVLSSLKAEEEANFYDLTPDTDSQIIKAFETADSLVKNAGGTPAASSSSAPASSVSAPANTSQSTSTPAE